jgi:hypothetical protein
MRTEGFDGYTCGHLRGLGRDLRGLADTWLGLAGTWLGLAGTCGHLAGTCGDLAGACGHLAGTCRDLAGTCGHLACLGILVVKMNIAHNIFFFHSNTTNTYTLNLNNSTIHLSWKLKMIKRWIKLKHRYKSRIHRLKGYTVDKVVYKRA